MDKKRSGQPSRKRGVQFQEDDKQHEEEGKEDISPSVRRKRPRRERPNADEIDDVDEWQAEVDGEEDELPSERESLQARRNRKLRREVGDDDENEETNINATTSLMADKENEVPISAFNMNDEQTDGMGYFEGDTYVFRRRDKDEEQDAWLESIDEKKETAIAKPKPRQETKQSNSSGMDSWTREELYAKILPLVSDSETVLQALVRYGNLIKRSKSELAQTSLNELTEASNALLLQGDVDIYQRTHKDILKLLPEGKERKQPPKPIVQWEYKGNQDGKIHGPYTTEQMISWTQAGYFIGVQAVQIRTLMKGTAKPKSTKDELLSDLMDDDEEEGEALKTEVVRGEWRSSNDVDFKAYA